MISLYHSKQMEMEKGGRGQMEGVCERKKGPRQRGPGYIPSPRAHTILKQALNCECYSYAELVEN